MRHVLILLVLGTLPVRLFAQEAVLLPVAGFVKDRFGTVLYVDNVGNEVIELLSYGCGPEGDCNYGRYHAWPGGWVQLWPRPSADAKPALLWFESGLAGARFTLRARSLREPDFGTAIPVVRMSELRTGTLVLDHVPVPSERSVYGSNFRKTLRIYTPLATGPEVFRIRVFREGDYEAATGVRPPIGEFTVETAPPTDFEQGRPTVPGYAQVDGFWDQSSYPPAEWDVVVRVEISPVNPDVRFWSFISVTHHDTDKILVVLPE